MEAILTEIGLLSLTELESGWVENIYNAEFLECFDLPEEYENAMESVELRRVFENLLKRFDFWLAQDFIPDDEKSWTTLSQLIEHKKIIALLFYAIDNGIKNVYTQEYRTDCILAARLYYKMLSVPGSNAYNIYHSQLFAHSLACLSFPKNMCEQEDCLLNSREMIRQINSVNRQLRLFVMDLKVVVGSMELSPGNCNFEEILNNLMNITGAAVANKLDIDKFELESISRISYEIVDGLLKDSEGVADSDAINVLFKCLLPKLVASALDCRTANKLLRASYVTYSGLLLSRYGKAALCGFNTLLQHLCYALDGLERAEVRQSRVSLVVGLMTVLPRRSHRLFVKWILELTLTSKAPHRHLALEILAKLLSNDPEAEEAQETISPDPVQPAENTPAGPGPTEELTQENPEDKKIEVVEDSQDSVAPIALDEDNVPLLSARVHTVPHATILRAVYDRAYDVSSTVRMRALAVLTQSVASDQPSVLAAVKALNGDEEQPTLIILAMKCMSDERAVVRRAAVSLVDVLMHHDRSFVNNTNLGVLVGLCRDASVLVRSAAITALGDLMITWPQPCTFDAFLSGPLHQLSDPELKVQEVIVGLVQHVLIERLQNLSPGSPGDTMPWMFLEAVTRHNMRRHLQKSCTLLAKTSKCMSHRLVDIISTQVGVSERSLSSLVLLSSIVRHVEYTEVDFLLNYYYELTGDLEAHDARLLPLVLEVLTEWSRWFSAQQRSDLRTHLVRGLCEGLWGSEGSRRSCAALAAHLDPNNVQWASDLLLACERRALDGAPVAEWVCAADMSLVAPEPPSSALVQLFITTVSDPPPELDSAMRGGVVAGLGRMCVRSRTVAASAAPVLARALASSTSPVCVRVNALLALTDICTRYTCIVEPLLGEVCACVEPSAAPALRRAAARALTRLLLGGFLRLRAPTYFKYCALLADADREVREPAEYYVSSCLTADAIYRHFVECISFYNGCSGHTPNQSLEECITFDSRQLIYDIMLQRMSLVQRLNIQCSLAKEVLVQAADQCDEGALSPGLESVLKDTVCVLRGPHMRLPRKPQTAEAADIDDLAARVTSNIVSQKMKCTVAEVLVPAVLRLYQRLRQSGGQLTTYLVRLATDLLKDYRQEIEELIDNDPELVEQVTQFQQNIGEEPSFGNKLNIVLRASSDADCTPSMKNYKRRAPFNRNHPPSSKKVLRL